MKGNTFESYFYDALSEIMIGLRLKNGRTFEDVADLLDIKSITFYAYEKGTRKMPITVFKKLCLLYNVDMKETLSKINALAAEKMG